MRPFGTPDCFEACSSQIASSSVSRIVTVLLIWRKCNIDEITLDEVAASVGTTRQTVIRLFGGKDGLLEAVIGLSELERERQITRLIVATARS